MELIKYDENLYIPSDFSKYHYYYADAEGQQPYTGITTILGVIAKPALIPWAVKQTAEYIKENAPVVEDGWVVNEDLLTEAKRAHKKTKEKAGSRGTDVHAEAESLVRHWIEEYDGKVPTAHPPVNSSKEVEQFVGWAYENEVTFHECEKPFYDTELWVAGTADLVLEVGGRKYLADIKTSKGVYEEAFMQTAAYRMMAEKMGITGFHGSMVIHLPANGKLKTYERHDYKADLGAFKAAHTLYKYKNNL